MLPAVVWLFGLDIKHQQTVDSIDRIGDQQRTQRLVLGVTGVDFKCIPRFKIYRKAVQVASLDLFGTLRMATYKITGARQLINQAFKATVYLANLRITGPWLESSQYDMADHWTLLFVWAGDYL